MPWNFYTASGALKNAEYVGSEFPAGTIVDFGGTSAPTGWLLCDGSTVSRTTYSSLFNVIGTAYGAGDGSTTFKIPDATGKIIYATPGLKLSAPISGSYVSSLPSSPFDGQEVYYQSTTAGTGGGTTNSMASVGAVWHLRFRSGSSSSFKWEFLGGATVSDYQASDSTRLVNTGWSASLSDGSTGPRLTLPLAGDYIVSLASYFRSGASNGVAWMSYSIGGATPVDSDGIFGEAAGDANSPSITGQFSRLKTGFSAVELLCQYKASGSSSSASFAQRSIFIQPVRVG